MNFLHKHMTFSLILSIKEKGNKKLWMLELGSRGSDWVTYVTLGPSAIDLFKMYRELILEKKNVSIVWCPTFLHSLIEQNSLKWKPATPREQRRSILDCCQEMILMTWKGFFMSWAVIWLQLNAPCSTSPPVDCQIYRWEMISSLWKASCFLDCVAMTYIRKDWIKLGKLSELFILKGLYFYGICMCFDWQIFVLLSLDSVTHCIPGSLEKFVSIFIMV